MKFWDRYTSWEEAEKAWQDGIEAAEAQAPVKKLKVLPQMPGITAETSHHLKWKSFKYMLTHDHGGKVLRQVLKHPFKYGFRYCKSLLKKKSYRRDGDFFLYGLPSIEAFESTMKQETTLLVAGFSYCQKPHECPSGRFNDQCIQNPEHPVCRQCDIGQVLHALPASTIPIIIPTVHHIGHKILELVHAHPDRQILFLITACEMTLEMFGDWGNMAGVKGIGVRLDGRICNTMRAFELSEEGIKPGLTVTTPETRSRILALVKSMRASS